MQVRKTTFSGTPKFNQNQQMQVRKKQTNDHRKHRGFYLNNSQPIFTDLSQTPSPSAITRRGFRKLQPPQCSSELPHRHSGGRQKFLFPVELLERITATTNAPLSGAAVDLPLGQGGLRPAPFSGSTSGKPLEASRSSGLPAGWPAVQLEIGVRRGSCNGRQK